MSASADSQQVTQQELEVYVKYYANTVVFNYADLAVFALLMFEYCITFDREARFAWGRRLSWTRGVFLLNRYLSILEYLLVLGPLLPISNTFSCIFLTKLMQGIQIVLYSAWAAFAGLRIYAISARNLPVTVLVIGLALVPAVTNSYVAVHTLIELSDLGCMSYIDSPDLPWTQLSVATRSCMVLSDALVIVVTWIKTWSTIRAADKLRIQMSFTSLILREGILYFVVMLSLNIVQVIFDFLEDGSWGMIIPFLNVITPILISRFFLDLDDLRTDEGQPPRTPAMYGEGGVTQYSTVQFVVHDSSMSDSRRSSLLSDYTP